MKIKYGECHCGCGEKTTIPTVNSASKNQFKGVPISFIHGHHPRKKVRYLVDNNNCWIWQLHIAKDGYGKDSISGVPVPAHRKEYERVKGKVPKGLFLDHLCRVRACINPDHLEVVTHTENVRRGSSTKVNIWIVTNIRTMYKTGKYTQKELGNIYGIHQSQISLIVRKKRWKAYA